MDDGDVVNAIAAVGVPTVEAVGEVGFADRVPLAFPLGTYASAKEAKQACEKDAVT